LGVIACIFELVNEQDPQQVALPSGAKEARVWLVAGAALRGIGAIALQRMIAVYYGPGGITLWAQLQNIVALLATPSQEIANRGMVQKATALEANSSERDGIYREGFWAHSYLLLILIVLLLGFVLATLAFPIQLCFLLRALFGANNTIFPLYGLSVFILPAALGFHYWYITKAQVEGAYKSGFLIQLASVGGGLLFLGSFLLLNSKPEIEIALALCLAGQGFAGVWVLLKQRKWIKETYALSKPFLKGMAGYAVFAVSSALAGKGVDLFVRSYALAQFTSVEVGNWQAAARIGEYLQIPFLAIASGYVFPQVRQWGAGKAIKTLQETVFFTLGAACLVLLIAIWAQETVHHLYGTGFTSAPFLLQLGTPGDALRISSLVPATVVLALGKPRQMLLLEIGSGLFYILLLAFLLPILGLAGFAVAHSIRYGGYLLATGVVAWRVLKVANG
jgi:polysaccharide transporter, PST family